MEVTNWSSITDLNEMLVSANSNTPFWLGMLVTIFAIFFITLSSVSNFVVGLIGASFITFIIGLFLAYLGLVAWVWVLMFFGILILTLLFAIFTKN